MIFFGKPVPTFPDHALAGQRSRKSGNDLDQIGMAAGVGFHKQIADAP